MPHYEHKGPGQMVHKEVQPEDQEVSEPQGADLAGAEGTFFLCTAPSVEDDEESCNRLFKKKMLMARHFNSTHEALKEDKDSWRDYCEEASAGG